MSSDLANRGSRLAELNPSQREAVSTLVGPLLVLAGAGTGKTRVITYRLAHLIERGCPPERTLSVTFTNKAAKEMRERTRALIGRRGGRGSRGPVISTFHSYCVRVLREEIEALGYPKEFAIYDRSDQESAARSALRNLRVGDDTIRPSDLVNRISRWKSAGVTPERAAEHLESDRDLLCSMAYRRYQKQLKGHGAVDFDDLLLLTRELFHRFPDIRDRQRGRFDFVQIDEYQDTNGLQFALVKELVGQHRNLCVVGDDDQSIYGWRGAEVQHILGFHTYFPDAKVVRLQDNYRCTDRILDLANRLVRHNVGRHEKELIAHKTAADEVRFLSFDDETIEAETVVAEIKISMDLGIPPGQFAILFRTNEQPRVFETELRRQQVPYHLVGGQSFFDRREIRDCLAYLKAMAFPKDEISLLRIINTPSRGIGSTSVEKILARAVREKIRFFEAVPKAVAAGEISARVAESIGSFRSLLDRTRANMLSQPDRLGAHFHSFLKQVDYEAEIVRQHKQPDQQTSRRAVLSQLIESLDQYTDRTPAPTLIGYLEETALTDRFDDSGDDQGGNRVKLMTLHSAKGLEFPRVYLVGLEEGLLPHKRSVEGDESAIAEERRLTYVGITRAMDHLTITRAENRMKWGRKKASIPSRFLFEMRRDNGTGLLEEE